MPPNLLSTVDASFEISTSAIRRACEDAYSVAQELKARPASIQAQRPSNALTAVGLRTAIRADPSLQQFDAESVLDAASEYEDRGLPRPEAEARAVSDHLRELSADRDRIERDVIDQFAAFDPQRFDALKHQEETP